MAIALGAARRRPAIGPLAGVGPALERVGARRRRGLVSGWGPAERRTLALAVVAVAATGAAIAVEVGRVWRRGSAPLPQEGGPLLSAAEEAVAETVEVAVAGYREVSTRENALFNLLSAFVVTFISARGITYLLRRRRRVGPFRDLRLGRRHIHHFVPGIVIGFAAGAAGILSRAEQLERPLATVFGVGLGLTLDESALLLELDDVYWSPEGLLSVQITLATIALLAALALGLRFVRRGERLVLEGPAEGSTAAPGQPAPAGPPGPGLQ